MSARKRDDCCAVVERDCEAPAGFESPASVLVTCYPCGRDVCRSCSDIVTRPARGLRVKRVRECFECRDERLRDEELREKRRAEAIRAARGVGC